MPDATSPAEILKKLELELDANQRNATRLKSQIADVKKTVDDIEQKTKDAEKAAAGNEENFLKLKEQADCKKRALEPKVPDPKAIEAREKEAAAKLKKLKDAADEARNAIGPLEINVAEAKVVTAWKQREFDEIAGIPARNTEILKEVTALLKQVETEEAAKNCSRAYFLVLVILDLLCQYDRRTPEEWAKALKEAGNALAEAARYQRAAEEKLEAAKADEKAKLKAYKDAKAKWVQEALEGIGKNDCRKVQPYEPPPGGYQPKPPGGYEPEPPGGYKPEPPGGYKPEPPGGYKPEPPGGYKPEPPGGYNPEPPGGYKPEPPKHDCDPPADGGYKPPSPKPT